MTQVLAPCPGTVLAMADVPDPVFAEEMVGPGVAIAPADGPTTVVSGVSWSWPIGWVVGVTVTPPSGPTAATTPARGP